MPASISDKPILKGINLAVPQGEVHAIMGPNGSGKSTLGYVLSGREDYVVTGGTVTFNGVDLLAMEPEQRAAVGGVPGFSGADRTAGRQQRELPPHRLERDTPSEGRDGAGRGAVP